MSDGLSKFMAEHGLRPPIAATYEFDEADKSIKALTSLSGVGKIVVRG